MGEDEKTSELEKNLSFLADLIPDEWRAPVFGIILFLAVAYYLPDIIKKWLKLVAFWKRGRAAEKGKPEIEASQPSFLELIVTTSFWFAVGFLYVNYVLF